MTQQEKNNITKVSQEFSKPLGDINGSGFMIVDPLAAYLEFIGYPNTIKQVPNNEKHPQVLIIIFKDDSQFIPAGADLKPIDESFENWMWI